MIVICKNCTTEFDKPPYEVKRSKNHFCSRSCAASHNNKGKQKNPPKIRYCKQCNSEFISNRANNRSIVLCSECVGQYNSRSEFLKSLTLCDYQNRESVKGKHPSWINSHIRNFNRSWNRDMTNLPCASCDYDKHVELCHRRAITSFSLTTTLGEINSRDNNIQLCRNCHWEFDNGLLTI